MEVEQNANAVVEDLKPDIPKPVKKKSLMRSFKKGMSKRVKSMRASMENFAEAVRTSSFRSSSSMRRSAKNAVAEAEAVDGGFENETDLPPTSTNGVHERVLDDANPPPKTDAKLAEQDTLSSEAAAAEARKAIEDSVKLHIDGAAVISEGQDLGDIKQEPAGDSGVADAFEMPTTDADTTQAEHKELPLKTRVVQADLVQDVQLLVTPREAEDGVDLVLAVRRQEKRRRASGRKVLLPGVLAGAAVAAAAVLLRAWA